ncbi:MAG: hypothetical protein IKR76_11990 [Ruminococcus sp.]|nr:hypothetical protein [Ruminococcus sp.]
MMRFIYHLTMIRSRRMIKAKYGDGFWQDFKNKSDRLFKKVLKKTPDIDNKARPVKPGFV